MIELEKSFKPLIMKRYALNEFEVNVLEFVYKTIRNVNIKQPFISSCLIAKLFRIDRHKSDRILKKLVDKQVLSRKKKLKKRYYEYFITKEFIYFLNELKCKEDCIPSADLLIKLFYGKNEEKSMFKKKFGNNLTTIKYGN